MKNPFENADVLRLALADLIHEWILSLCLVMAVAAVLSPLFLLFGLKHGTIETMRRRLIQDPRNREIRPLVSSSFTKEWINALGERPDVAFIVANTRQVSAMVKIRAIENEKTGNTLSVNVIPTGDGDRLILENGSSIPGEDQCVLTASAAEAIDVKKGATVIIEMDRIKKSRVETCSFESSVAGILDRRASSMKAVFLRLETLEAIEQFKDGIAVSRYGCPGSIPLAYVRYDGVVVILDRKLDDFGELTLINHTGFTGIRPLSQTQLLALAGFQTDPDRFVYFLHTDQRAVNQESIDAVRNKLRGKHGVIIPWVKPFEAALLDNNGHLAGQVHLLGLTLSPEQGLRIGLHPIPPWNENLHLTKEWRKIMLPRSITHPGSVLFLKVNQDQRFVQFPVEPLEEAAPGSHAIIPARLAGVLNLLKERDLSYQVQEDQFVLERQGYAGFRLYAKTIDHVDNLSRHLEKIGIPVHTEAERIRDVTQLNRYLTLIFWLVASVGLIGGVAALVASLYASVERKKKEIGVLRLIGLSGSLLIRFPVYQGLFIVFTAYLFALGFFYMLAYVINILFATHLQSSESLCSLSASHLMFSFTGTVLLAVLAGGIAAWRVSRIDPAKALRDE